MKNTAKHIILSTQDRNLSNIVANYLANEFGLELVDIEVLDQLPANAHGVAIISSATSLSRNIQNSFIAHLDEYFTKNAVELSGQVFDNACDYYLGNLSADQLLACA